MGQLAGNPSLDYAVSAHFFFLNSHPVVNATIFLNTTLSSMELGYISSVWSLV